MTAAGVVVEDDLARRIRRPGDLLRCAAAFAGIALLVAAGLLAKATTSGVETDVVGASRRLPSEVLSTLRVVAILVLVLLPVALAIRQLVRRQARRLAEAVATGVATAVVVGLAGLGLRTGLGDQLYRAIAMSSPGARHFALLDGYLAGLVAYTTIIDLSGRPRWRNALWLTLGVYAVASLATLRTTVLSVLITLLLGRAIGLAVRYAAGSMSQRPSGEAIAAALAPVGLTVTELRRVDAAGAASRRYVAVTRDGGRLDVRVFDRDQQAAGALYRVYRLVRLRGQVSRRAPLTTDRAAERTALLTYAVEDAGVPTPRLRALVRAGPEALVLATEEPHGTAVADLAGTLTDAQLELVWDAVLRLHAHRVAHRSLTADRILIDAGQVILLDPGIGDVAASDLQLRLDLSQLLAELAALVGPDRAADLALRRVGPAELVTLVPLLQPVVLARSTRSTLRRDKDVLPALRKRLLATAPDDVPEVPPVQLERIRLRTLVTLVATVLAGYLLIVQLGRVNFATLLSQANPLWILVALGLSALTYVAAALSLSGFVPGRLNFIRTMLAQLAGSFVTLVTPAAVGGAALNLRYLQRNKVPPAVAAASVGVVQVVAFVLHILLLVIFVAITGARSHSLRPPTWVYFVIAGLVVAALGVAAVPQGRRLLRARLAPALGQVLPRLLEVLQQPRKLAEGLGGALMLTACYILCLDACVRAFGGSLALTSAAVVYLTGSALGSLVPTPGGLGAVEAALAAGLTATGMAAATAVSAVLLFRLLTFWLPVPAGWGAFTYLRRRQAL
ncbi:MAG: glycosyltransferase 2 family protein [Streptosporangiaceae bacterium]|nr:glycosyltransferase 2 family protein [Streptosporangiaceae bacterium]